MGHSGYTIDLNYLRLGTPGKGKTFTEPLGYVITAILVTKPQMVIIWKWLDNLLKAAGESSCKISSVFRMSQ